MTDKTCTADSEDRYGCSLRSVEEAPELHGHGWGRADVEKDSEPPRRSGIA